MYICTMHSCTYCTYAILYTIQFNTLAVYQIINSDKIVSRKNYKPEKILFFLSRYHVEEDMSFCRELFLARRSTTKCYDNPENLRPPVELEFVNTLF